MAKITAAMAPIMDTIKPTIMAIIDLLPPVVGAATVVAIGAVIVATGAATGEAMGGSMGEATGVVTGAATGGVAAGKATGAATGEATGGSAGWGHGGVDGVPVGVVDGVSVGVVDGTTVGGVDGVPVGSVDGLTLGGVDGMPDGRVDGVLDGVPVGCVEGTTVGCVDGTTLGGLDGKPVGGADGMVVGVTDGADVVDHASISLSKESSQWTQSYPWFVFPQKINSCTSFTGGYSLLVTEKLVFEVVPSVIATIGSVVIRTSMIKDSKWERVTSISINANKRPIVTKNPKVSHTAQIQIAIADIVSNAHVWIGSVGNHDLECVGTGIISVHNANAIPHCSKSVGPDCLVPDQS